jgi:tetratricopeptide (TPR) repeat protein
MPRHSLRRAVLALALFSPSALAQFTPGVVVLLYGTVTINAKEGTPIPGALFVVLYNTFKVAVNRQAIANHGNYQFKNVGTGDWEIAIEADGNELLRIPYTNFENHNTEVRKNFDVQLPDAPTPKLPKAGVISVSDIYARNPENMALMQQAQAAQRKKSYGEAVELLRSIVDADPKDFEAWTDLGNVLYAQGDQGQAEKAFQRALEDRPSYPLALLNLGKVNYGQKNYDAAITTLSRLVAAHPEAAEAHRFLGESYLGIKKGSKAVPELEEAARLDPENQAEAHLSLAALYDAVNLKDRAAAEYEQFLAIKPNYADKKELEKYIRDNKKL